jgi:hypothetical protein
VRRSTDTNADTVQLITVEDNGEHDAMDFIYPIRDPEVNIRLFWLVLTRANRFLAIYAIHMEMGSKIIILDYSSKDRNISCGAGASAA